MNTKEKELKEFTSASIAVTSQACERIKKAMKVGAYVCLSSKGAVLV